jgi:hypothetical protein
VPSSTQNASPIAAKTAATAANPAQDPKPAAAAKPARATSVKAQSTPKTAAKPAPKPAQKTASNDTPNTAAAATSEKSEKTAKSAPAPAPADNSGGRSITVTIPVTMEQVVSATIAVAHWRTGAIRKVASTKHGLPLYLGIGGLAVVGLAVWPAAAAAGVGIAVLRRWGPLRPESAPVPADEEITIDDTPTDIPIDEDAAPAPVA